MQASLDLVNATGLQLECARDLHESLLMYGTKTMLWKEKERSGIRDVQMDNFRVLLSLRRIDKVQNAWIRELCRVTKGVLRWFGHVERMENDWIAKRAYVGEYGGSRSVGRPRKR